MNAFVQLVVLLAPFCDPQATVVVVGKGAGVVIDPRGYVVTCHHVVPGDGPVLVRLCDGRVFVGHLAARDAGRELALLRLDTDRRFAWVRLAAGSPKLREPVTCIGHPKGYEWTINSGHVTGLSRTIQLGEDGPKIAGLFQTDASINPGNSGGALLDGRGQLLGLPVAIRDGAQGIAFAIPAARVREFLDTHLPKGP